MAKLNDLVNLKKKPDGKWVVTYLKNREQLFEKFDVIDAACDFMVDKLGVDDNEVDLALIEMTTREHTIAIISDGEFNHTLLD